MKRSSLFTPALALAFGLCATGAMATTATPVSEDFEGDAFASGINGVTTNNLTWADTEGYSAVSGGKLVVDAADTPTSATIDPSVTNGINSAFGARNAKFNATVTFVPATEDPVVTGADLKFALYAKAVTGATNLYVIANGGAQSTGISLANVVDQNVEVAFTAADTFTVKVGASTSSAFTFANSGDISKVEFSGNGEVEQLGFSYDLVDTAITWPTTMTVASYTVDGGESVDLEANSGTATVSTEPGAAIALTLTNADGVSKTVNGTAGTAIDATGVTFGWADYLGDAIAADTYGIDNLVELKLFQKGVAAGLATASTTFNLTSDITLDIAWPGIGIQNGKDIYSTENFNTNAFRGTFDGKNHTISGFQMQGGGLDYCGFFNSTYGATIQNLKIAYAGGLFATDTTENSSAESGATFVGVAKDSTLRNLTTLAGTVSCDKGFGGIVGYLTSGTLVDSCTNNVNMTSLRPNKCGGIAMITQNGSAVTIVNCQNNGTIAGSNETGSLVGFVGLGTTISNCDSTVAYKLFHHNSGTVTISDVTADASVAAYTGTATPGLNFAMVSGNVATFVADNALAAGNIYKVMGPSATATFAFAAPGTIAFDTALATPTFAITAAEGLTLTDATSGTVKTYTAEELPSYAAGDNPVDDDSSYTISTAEANYLNDLVTEKGADAVKDALDSISAQDFADAVLLNQDITDPALNAGTAKFEISNIKNVTGGIEITVKLQPASKMLGNTINGHVNLYAYNPVSGEYVKQDGKEFTFTFANPESPAATTATVIFDGDYSLFKAVIEE